MTRRDLLSDYFVDLFVVVNTLLSYQSCVGVEVELVDVQSEVAPMSVFIEGHVTRRTFQLHLHHNPRITQFN